MSGSFLGYPRSSGRAGIRNHLLVLSVCGLNSAGARKVAAALPGAVLMLQPYGRGQLGADFAYQDAVLTRLATHSNVGAVVLLAPDAAMRRRYQDRIEASGRPVAGFSLQEAGEDGERIVAEAVAAGHHLQTVLATAHRTPVPVSDLVIAMECGHSDASSGILANPLAGDIADRITALGGAAVMSETMEWLGTEASLAARASPDVAARLRALVAARHAIALEAGQSLHLGNPGPQNHEGGITTLEEKSFGAISKGGTGAIRGALAAAEPIPGPGLYLMDTPTLSPESITAMVAGGAQLVIFTTGHGNPYGSAIAPTIKLTANPETARRLPRQIDFDASPGWTGRVPRTELVAPLFDLVLAVCAGRTTAAERLDEGCEVISRLGPSV
ncbi:MAG: UxaA family hydrolase [Pseudorhodobacter sp.]